MKILLFLFVVVLVLVVCLLLKIEFQIDNLIDMLLVLSIDGQDLLVVVYGLCLILFVVGEYCLYIDMFGDVCFIVYVDGCGGLINLILSEYVIVCEVYVIDESKLKNFGIGKVGIELGGVDFEGFFEKCYDLFIDKIWIYGVCELFLKEKVVVYVDFSGGQIVVKVFMVLDFIVYVEEGMGELGVFKCEQLVGYVVLVYRFELVLVSLLVLVLVFEVYIVLLCEVYVQWLKVIIVDEQKVLCKQDFVVQMVFILVIVILGSGLGWDVNEVYNDFVFQCSQLMGCSVLVVF